MKSGKADIKDAKFFVEYADLAIDNIKSRYLLVNEVYESQIILILHKDNLNSRGSPSKKRINVNGVCKFQFFIVASVSLPLHMKFRRKYGDPEVCNHLLLSLLLTWTTHELLVKELFREGRLA